MLVKAKNGKSYEVIHKNYSKESLLYPNVRYICSDGEGGIIWLSDDEVIGTIEEKVDKVDKGTIIIKI